MIFVSCPRLSECWVPHVSPQPQHSLRESRTAPCWPPAGRRRTGPGPALPLVAALRRARSHGHGHDPGSGPEAGKGSGHRPLLPTARCSEVTSPPAPPRTGAAHACCRGFLGGGRPRSAAQGPRPLPWQRRAAATGPAPLPAAILAAESRWRRRLALPPRAARTWRRRRPPRKCVCACGARRRR